MGVLAAIQARPESLEEALGGGGGDLDNDGKPDLAVANIGHDNVAVLLGNGVGAFSAPVTFAVGAQPRSVSLGDLNGDQKLDLVTANFNSGNVTVLFGDGFGGFGVPSHISVPGFNPEYASIADFNNDGIPDLVVAYLNASSISILLGNGAGGFDAPSFIFKDDGEEIAQRRLVVDDQEVHGAGL